MQGDVVPTRYWTEVRGGRIQCDVCPRFCRLAEGQRGFCFVRARENDEIVLTTYGRSSGFCIDPIEKKPLNHFYPGTSVLSFGTAGCNLACNFCQNWDISKSREIDTLADSASPDQLAKAAARHGCRSVAYTYNDPVVFMEYAIDVAQACSERGIRSVAVTAGYMCEEPREEFYKHMDAANVDLKAITDDFYWKLAKGRLQPVLDTLLYIQRETDVWLEITNLLIPKENDSEKELSALTEWIAVNLGPEVPLHFTAFHPDWKMREKPATSWQTLRMARRIALQNGLRHVYTGNVHDPEGQSTYCQTCHQVVIERSGYTLGRWNLDEESRCSSCQTSCAGHFEARPGNWGSRRRPVRLGSCPGA